MPHGEPPRSPADADLPRPASSAREHELEAEVARLRARCAECGRVLRISRERDAELLRADELAELDRLKSDFFADVSHEFRTPLTLVLGPLRDLEAGTWGELSAAALQQVDLAIRNGERLLGLVEQLLDSARLDAGGLSLRVRRIDLGELLADVRERFAGMAERRRARLVFEPPAETVRIWCDPVQLEKVFANLISNALRYSPQRGRVEMTLRRPDAAGRVAVTVRDEGPGIALGDRDRIFDRFRRASQVGAASSVGTGLGLPLARSLTELHTGTLTLESASGEGCIFRVELPVGQDLATQDQPAHAASAAPTGAERRRFERRTPSQSGDRTTVLVVDDHPGIRRYVRRHLKARYRVEEAADGAEALELARDLLPDLVISDVMMPEMNGHELCRALKRDPHLDWIPVVLLTARAATDDKLEGLDDGADDYLTKPFNARELVARVDNLIASRRRLKERFAAPPLPRIPLAPGVRPTADDREWLGRVCEAIQDGLGDEGFSVAILARSLAVDRSQLYRRLRRLTGRSPSQLIANARLGRAAALLRSQTGSVSEVAYDAGFQSVAHFSRRFRELFGVPPSAWRRQSG